MHSIGKRQTATTAVASGVWLLREQAQWKKDGLWPNFSPATYWRILQTQDSYLTTYGVYMGAMCEINFYESPDCSGSEAVNISSFFASSQVNTDVGPEKAGDNNNLTLWGSAHYQPTPHYWGIVYTVAKRIRSVSIYPQQIGTPVSHAAQYKLQKSNNGSVWIDVAIFSPANSTSLQTFTYLQ